MPITIVMRKKDRIKSTFSGKIYEVVGRWRSDIIRSPVEADDEECRVYTPGEIKELLETGEFVTRKECRQ